MFLCRQINRFTRQNSRINQTNRVVTRRERVIGDSAGIQDRWETVYSAEQSEFSTLEKMNIVEIIILIIHSYIMYYYKISIKTFLNLQILHVHCSIFVNKKEEKKPMCFYLLNCLNYCSVVHDMKMIYLKGLNFRLISQNNKILHVNFGKDIYSAKTKYSLD